MMTNVRCVTVFCIDMKGLSQHSVQLKNRSDFDIEMLRDCGFVRKERALFHPPASSSDQSLLDNF